jgi:hypothetical protein
MAEPDIDSSTRLADFVDFEQVKDLENLRIRAHGYIAFIAVCEVLASLDIAFSHYRDGDYYYQFEGFLIEGKAEQVLGFDFNNTLVWNHIYITN